MTSLHSTSHQYASTTTTTPFHILPSCRFHGEHQQQSTDSNNVLSGSSLTRRPSTTVIPNGGHAHDWSTAFHHSAGKLAYGNGSSISTLANATSNVTTNLKNTTGNNSTCVTAAASTTTLLPLHTDPEMYALRNKYSSISESKVYNNSGNNLSSSTLPATTSPVAVKPTQHVNNRLAYVEALVGKLFLILTFFSWFSHKNINKQTNKKKNQIKSNLLFCFYIYITYFIYRYECPCH